MKFEHCVIVCHDSNIDSDSITFIISTVGWLTTVLYVLIHNSCTSVIYQRIGLEFSHSTTPLVLV